MKTKEDIKQYFKDLGLWEKITEAIVEYPYESNVIFSDNWTETFLEYSFFWSKTKEGTSYWGKVNEDYRKWYDTKLDKELTPIEAFNELIKRRDKARKSWLPDWDYSHEYKYSIFRIQRIFKIDKGTFPAFIFSFETEQQAQQFFNNNQILFEKIKQLY